MLRMIPTWAHGLMDYLMAGILIATPWLFGFARGGAETWVPVFVGLSVVGYSLCTRYELGLFPLIPMPVHLMLDAGGGLLLAASPWLFGFSGWLWVPHVVLGLMELGAAGLTAPDPDLPLRMSAGGHPLPPG